MIDIIRPAGFYNQKARYLKAVTEWYAGYGCDVPTVQNKLLGKLRSELLGLKGVGLETADSILLHDFGFHSFVIDAYTVRLCERIPINAGKGYEEMKAYFESEIPASVEMYNNYHALIVINGKEHCNKNPSCAGCPLWYDCEGKNQYIDNKQSKPDTDSV